MARRKPPTRVAAKTEPEAPTTISLEERLAQLVAQRDSLLAQYEQTRGAIAALQDVGQGVVTN